MNVLNVLTMDERSIFRLSIILYSDNFCNRSGLHSKQKIGDVFLNSCLLRTNYSNTVAHH